MQIIYTPKANEHLNFWVKTGNKIILKKIFQLTEAILENPCEGMGKPEPLKHSLSGCWSRRIDKKNRLVYKATENVITVLSMKGHYED